MSRWAPCQFADRARHVRLISETGRFGYVGEWRRDIADSCPRRVGTRFSAKGGRRYREHLAKTARQTLLCEALSFSPVAKLQCRIVDQIGGQQIRPIRGRRRERRQLFEQ
jgi:hypothetical protein